MKYSLLLVFALTTLLSSPARADENPRPDDKVIFDLAAEDWVMTKTARVSVNVEAAVSDKNAGSMRADMIKAVNDVAKADWRLTNFTRTQDQTGLERWSASFDARLPENQLTGLNDNAKKLSKAGMQLSVGDIDFSPTLDEMEAARGNLRTKLYKQANDQLAALNAALPGRNYRIATINFVNANDDGMPVPMPKVLRGQPNMMMAAAPAASAPAAMERAEKITLAARIIFAALPDAKAAKP